MTDDETITITRYLMAEFYPRKQNDGVYCDIFADGVLCGTALSPTKELAFHAALSSYIDGVVLKYFGRHHDEAHDTTPAPPGYDPRK